MADKTGSVLNQLEIAVFAAHLPLVAKVAEMLAADEEYDAAKSAKWDATGLKNEIAAEKRFGAAKKRRVAAIRAMRGES